jgi:hypothetical protein
MSRVERLDLEPLVTRRLPLLDLPSEFNGNTDLRSIKTVMTT